MADLPSPPTPATTCVCGHPKRAHIYEEGACRPGGVVCPCPRFRPVSPVEKTMPKRVEADLPYRELQRLTLERWVVERNRIASDQ